MLAKTPKSLLVEDQDFDTLLQAWLDHIPRVRELRAAHRAAQARMPWWAQSGPKSVRGDGVLTGGITAVPALHEFTMPDALNVSRTIRPGAYDFKERYENPVYGSRERAAEILKTCLDRLAEREAAQEIERKKAGVNKTAWALRRAEYAWYNDRNRISDLGPSPARLAFRSLARIIGSADGHVSFPKQCRDGATHVDMIWHERDILLETLPALSPLLRSTVERIMDGGKGPLRKWVYWLGSNRDYDGGGDPPPELIQPWRPTEDAA